MNDTTRIYHYYIKGKMVPDIESMCAFLLDEGILYVTSAIERDTNNECIGLYILINDYFVPAADSESVTYDEIPKLFKMYKEKKQDGVAQFVADKRGIPNIYWKEKDSNFKSNLEKHKFDGNKLVKSVEDFARTLTMPELIKENQDVLNENYEQPNDNKPDNS